ncbi:hypothetical protein [Levilactobacillus sp. HBUAS70063]|uniref:hypothetical protein n=1 Tax=Levilactobacillus sp. HBUAS70063 TaxID=3109359 RepID=UPI003132A8EA
MKGITAILILVMTGLIIGGTMWGLLAWALTGWIKVLFGLAGLAVATVVNLGLFWFLWPRQSDEDD